MSTPKETKKQATDLIIIAGLVAKKNGNQFGSREHREAIAAFAKANKYESAEALLSGLSRYGSCFNTSALKQQVRRAFFENAKGALNTGKRTPAASGSLDEYDL